MMLVSAELKGVSTVTKCPTLPPMHPDTCRFLIPTLMHALKIAGLESDVCDLRHPHSRLKYHE